MRTAVEDVHVILAECVFCMWRCKLYRNTQWRHQAWAWGWTFSREKKLSFNDTQPEVDFRVVQRQFPLRK